MDKLLYVAMSGAKETLRAPKANSRNLANASTRGFKADLTAFQSQANNQSWFCRAPVRDRHICRLGSMQLGGAEPQRVTPWTSLFREMTSSA